MMYKTNALVIITVILLFITAISVFGTDYNQEFLAYLKQKVIQIRTDIESLRIKTLWILLDTTGSMVKSTVPSAGYAKEFLLDLLKNELGTVNAVGLYTFTERKDEVFKPIVGFAEKNSKQLIIDYVSRISTRTTSNVFLTERTFIYRSILSAFEQADQQLYDRKGLLVVTDVNNFNRDTSDNTLEDVIAKRDYVHFFEIVIVNPDVIPEYKVKIDAINTMNDAHKVDNFDQEAIRLTNTRNDDINPDPFIWNNNVQVLYTEKMTAHLKKTRLIDEIPNRQFTFYPLDNNDRYSYRNPVVAYNRNSFIIAYEEVEYGNENVITRNRVILQNMSAGNKEYVPGKQISIDNAILPALSRIGDNICLAFWQNQYLNYIIYSHDLGNVIYRKDEIYMNADTAFPVIRFNNSKNSLFMYFINNQALYGYLISDKDALNNYLINYYSFNQNKVNFKVLFHPGLKKNILFWVDNNNLYYKYLDEINNAISYITATPGIVNIPLNYSVNADTEFDIVPMDNKLFFMCWSVKKNGKNSLVYGKVKLEINDKLKVVDEYPVSGCNSIKAPKIIINKDAFYIFYSDNCVSRNYDIYVKKDLL